MISFYYSTNSNSNPKHYLNPCCNTVLGSRISIGMQFNSQEKQALDQAVQNLIGSDGKTCPRNIQQTDRLFYYVNEKWMEWLAHTDNISTMSHKMLVKVGLVCAEEALGFVPLLSFEFKTMERE